MGMPYNHPLFRHKQGWLDSSFNPNLYLLEILSTRAGAPSWTSATGSLVANSGQTVSCSRGSSAYCLGDDGLLHLLGANTVRVEPSGLLVEGASTNFILSSQAIGDANWSYVNNASPVVCTLNSTDVTDPAGGNTATKVAVPAVTAATYALVGQAPAGANTPGCQSVYMRSAPGAGSVQFNFSSNNYNNIWTVTEQWQRFVLPEAVSAGQFWLGWNGTVVGAQSAVTVYAWQAQAETGVQFATSPILTTSTSATRAGEIVSVPSPLASLNPTNWRIALTATPITSWANINTANGGATSTIIDLIGPSDYGGTNVVNYRVEDATRTTLWVDDAAGLAKGLVSNGVLSGSATVSFLGTDANGTLGNSPGTPSAPVGTGTGIVGTQQTTAYLGVRAGGGSPLWGHLTDIYVDNT